MKLSEWTAFFDTCHVSLVFEYNLSMEQNRFFNEQKWHDALTTRHDWYRVIYPEFEQILAKYEGSDISTRKASRDAVYGFLELLLQEGRVMLGEKGKDWDADRKPIDTVVIHHTKVKSGITWQRLDAMHLLRLYAKSYHAPSTEKEIEGRPLWSNHFRGDDGKRRIVFYAYHWIVRQDGTAERLLNDNEIGWQAGNWDINCRSIGICLDGDYEHTPPPNAMIEGVKRLIGEEYANVMRSRIMPHKNVNPTTTCPGDWFTEEILREEK